MVYVDRVAYPLTLCVGLALALVVAAPGPAGAETVAGAEVRVIDGDTVMVRGERIRLLEPGIPEISKPRWQNELFQGLHASDRLPGLHAQPIEIRRGGHSDRYGRTRASLIAPFGNVAEILIAEKRALPYRPGSDRRRHWYPLSAGKQTP